MEGDARIEERTATRLEEGERAVGRCPAERMKLLSAARDAMVERGGAQMRGGNDPRLGGRGWSERRGLLAMRSGGAFGAMKAQ